MTFYNQRSNEIQIEYVKKTLRYFAIYIYFDSIIHQKDQKRKNIRNVFIDVEPYLSFTM
jgi:nucleoside-specific outer membrane channel protein Tsx